ncbi:MAG: ATP-binding cassette domain-containing protein [Burkholderiaceae bacterium]|jgi:ATP-binding cassette subfamily F protein 3|nr:ATP-binding cassette domain-containing protein [Burkholderiaceae bacterium]
MITLKNVTLRRGAKVLLDDASAVINPGERVGLVGHNGAGKSSLFALFEGRLHEDSGDCTVPAHWRMAQVAQNMPETSEPATAFVIGGDTVLVQRRAALASAEAADASLPGDAARGLALAQAHVDLADAGEHDAAPRAQALLLGLGFKSNELEQPVNSFSGGWRMRLQLARALMCPSDLLLLDEPTNHLDLDALVWLESWLQKYPGTLLVISHDREFLDAISTVTLHIEHARLTRYGGNYSAFETLRAQQIEQQHQAYTRQQEKIAHLQKFIDRFKAKATKARQAQSRVKALERMEKIAPLLAEADFSFVFKEPAQIPNPMLSVRQASMGYRCDSNTQPQQQQQTQQQKNPIAPPKRVLSGVNRSVLAGQRIGILGANGQGKSTLVKTIAHELTPLSGTLIEGKGLRIGYFAQQELDVLRAQDTPLEHLTRLARQPHESHDLRAIREKIAPPSAHASEQELRGFLGSFNFSGDMVKQPVGTMSGGEKARLVLALMVWQRPNLLLLDEPTNHLDLATREALAVALNEFEGTLMLVSHDRALLRSVCDSFWLVGEGQVSDFDGDLDDYQQYLLDQARRARDALREAARKATAETTGSATGSGAGAAADGATQASASHTARATAPPTLTPREQRQLEAQIRQQRQERQRPLQRELAHIDQRLNAATSERTALEQRLCEPLPPAEIADTGRRLKALTDEISALEERWLALSEQIETL